MSTISWRERAFVVEDNAEGAGVEAVEDVVAGDDLISRVSSRVSPRVWRQAHPPQRLWRPSLRKLLNISLNDGV